MTKDKRTIADIEDALAQAAITRADVSIVMYTLVSLHQACLGSGLEARARRLAGDCGEMITRMDKESRAAGLSGWMAVDDG